MLNTQTGLTDRQTDRETVRRTERRADGYTRKIVEIMSPYCLKENYDFEKY